MSSKSIRLSSTFAAYINTQGIGSESYEDTLRRITGYEPRQLSRRKTTSSGVSASLSKQKRSYINAVKQHESHEYEGDMI